MNENQFESCGARLRNLLTPYGNLIALVDGLKRGEMSMDMFNTFTTDIKSGMNKLLEFSKTDVMENTNCR